MYIYIYTYMHTYILVVLLHAFIIFGHLYLFLNIFYVALIILV